MKCAYADPPYFGLAKEFYGDLHPNAAEYDDPMTHKRLIERLSDEYDAWALSMGTTTLRLMLPWCPDDVRIGSWVKPFASFKLNVTRAYTWEPVLFRFSNKRTREQGTWRDHIAESITLKRGFRGAKPEKVCFWIFDGLNIIDGDEFVDLFPGSGAVGRAFEKWRNRAMPEQFLLEASIA
jgi:hypothetical protein